jgi:pimeloyl-ACP methyl ester carboxylesterase
MVSVDYPGFGNSDMPGPETWDYTFDHITDIVEAAVQKIGFVGPMGFYMHDYGGPVGQRLIAKHPEWLAWQVVQNSNAYEEGFTKAWDDIRYRLWTNRSAETETPLETFFEHDTVKTFYLTGHPDPSKVSPDAWNMDLYFLARPGADRVQRDLFYDYRTNVELYPKWQEDLRARQPKTIIFWGQGDIFFTPEGGEAYLRDLREAWMVRLDSGHFAVEDCLDQIAGGIVNFYDTVVQPTK